jgi:hypothetical protein
MGPREHVVGERREISCEDRIVLRDDSINSHLRAEEVWHGSSRRAY